jgi:phosphoglycolate phosphatase
MMTTNYKRAVIFDMDGTLFATEKVLIPALHKTFDNLRLQKKWSGETPVDPYLKIIGAPLPEVWNKLMPHSSDEIKKETDHLFLEMIVEEISLGNGELYPGVINVLNKLQKEGIPMFIASNGLEKYIDTICDVYHLREYFDDLYSAGRFKCSSKIELVEKLMNDHQLTCGMMVGDRRSDIEAGNENHLVTIGCDFGFASDDEFHDADYIINRFEDVLNIVFQKIEL